MRRLEGKIAVITGSTSGIGLATAKRFVVEGAYVFITGRRRKELDAAVAAIGSNATGVQGDVSNLADLDRLYEVVKAEKGRIDILYANAGISESAPIGAVTEEHFDKIFAVNVRGMLFTVQKALPLLNDRGSIIMTGSMASIKGFANFGVYNASKAAVRSFARTWTVDLKAEESASMWSVRGPLKRASLSKSRRRPKNTYCPSFRWALWASPTKSPRSPSSLLQTNLAL